MKHPLLEVQSLKKWFIINKSISSLLKGIDLVIEEKTSYAIIGRSGAGKTTLLQILATLDSFSEGKLLYQGKNIQQLDQDALRNKEFGFVFQSFYLLDDLSSLENVLLPAHIAKQSPLLSREHIKRAHELLDRCQILAKKDLKAALLSGGEKQRVAIARALFMKPRILFLDEPTGSLDKTTEDVLIKLLFQTASEEGTSLVLVTHNEALAKQADHHFILEDGKLNQLN